MNTIERKRAATPARRGACICRVASAARSDPMPIPRLGVTEKITNRANLDRLDQGSLARIHKLDELVAAIGRESDSDGSLKTLVEI